MQHNQLHKNLSSNNLILQFIIFIWHDLNIISIYKWSVHNSNRRSLCLHIHFLWSSVIVGDKQCVRSNKHMDINYLYWV